ncbi:coronin-1C-like [Saccoglossus kowalevskii]|uniref:Coronin n=1 Tax=Saccoglossus kowalevskii TaxID=10224 RepID=A0ABM0ML69_SACKO|nr:PREDICTED: coronin-1C-like [Saccoglossus kowalevskii]
MSVRVVRQSKYRHIFGKVLKKENCYDGVRVTRSSQDGTFCSANSKFVAICIEAAGGGAFLVLKTTGGGRIDMNAARVCGHKAEVLDLAWCPFNDNIIASSSEDCSIKLWEIPDEGLTENLTEYLVDLQYHQRRVTQILWHPSALNILLSVGQDDKILIWNVSTAEILVEVNMESNIFCASWNYNGSLFATTSKDKKLRVHDARSGEVKQEGNGHEGAKPQRVVFLKDNKIITTGFSKMSERQYALWDADDLSNPVILENLDTSNGTMFPFYDQDCSVLYLAGKGDGSIRYFEISDEPPFIHYLNTYTSSSPQRGLGFMNKRGCLVNSCEIARFYKLHQKGVCEPISMIVPRKSDLFQSDIFPDTVSDEPAITAEDWSEGKDADPNTMSMKTFYHETERETKMATKPKANLLAKKVTVKSKVEEPPKEVEKPKPKKVVIAASTPVKTEERHPPKKEETPRPEPSKPSWVRDHHDDVPKQEVKPQSTNAASAPPSVSNAKFDELMQEMKRLKATVAEHEERIKTLEEQGVTSNKQINDSEED